MNFKSFFVTFEIWNIWFQNFQGGNVLFTVFFWFDSNKFINLSLEKWDYISIAGWISSVCLFVLVSEKSIWMCVIMRLLFVVVFFLQKSLLNKFVEGFKIRFKVQTWSFPQHIFPCVRSLCNCHLYNKCSLIRSKCMVRAAVWTEKSTAYSHRLPPFRSIFVYIVPHSLEMVAIDKY